MKKSQYKIRYDDGDDWNQNLSQLLSQIKQKFRFLKQLDDSQWTLCINSQFIDKRDAKNFGTILSSIPSNDIHPVVVEIVRPKKMGGTSTSAGKFVIIHHNNQEFKYILDDDADEWDDATFEIITKAIAKRFNIHGSFEILTKNSHVDIDDIKSVKKEFDAAGDDEVHFILEVI